MNGAYEWRIVVTCHRRARCSVGTRIGVTRVGDTRGGNWGCHPSIFTWKTWRPFLVASSAVSPLTTFFCLSLYRFLLLSLRCHSIEGVTLHLFYLSDLVSPLFFVNLPTKKFSFLFPLEVSPGAVRPLRPPLVTPLGVTLDSKCR